VLLIFGSLERRKRGASQRVTSWAYKRTFEAPRVDGGITYLICNNWPQRFTSASRHCSCWLCTLYKNIDGPAGQYLKFSTLILWRKIGERPVIDDPKPAPETGFPSRRDDSKPTRLAHPLTGIMRSTNELRLENACAQGATCRSPRRPSRRPHSSLAKYKSHCTAPFDRCWQLSNPVVHKPWLKTPK
jgi:hypothetical protein